MFLILLLDLYSEPREDRVKRLAENSENFVDKYSSIRPQSSRHSVTMVTHLSTMIIYFYTHCYHGYTHCYHGYTHGYHGYTHCYNGYTLFTMFIHAETITIVTHTLLPWLHTVTMVT